MRGRDQADVERFLTAPVRRTLEDALEDDRFEVKKGQLSFHTWSGVDDEARLLMLRDLFEDSLAQLQEISLASR